MRRCRGNGVNKQIRLSSSSAREGEENTRLFHLLKERRQREREGGRENQNTGRRDEREGKKNRVQKKRERRETTGDKEGEIRRRRSGVMRGRR